MSDAVWYYAHGDKEQGPVTLVQLKGLIQANKLLPDDLVWKDGMDDWVAAESVPGLFTKEASLAEAPVPVASGGAGKGRAPAEAAPRIEAPAKPPGGVGAAPAPPPAAPPAASEPPPETRRAKQKAVAESNESDEGDTVGPRKITHWAGWGLAILGLFLVLTAKGCDSIGQRYSASVRAAVAAGASGYAEKDAATADAGYRFWSLGREFIFLFGAVVLVAGLATNGIGGNGAEKWLSLVMLAIIIYSVFVGGAAWSSGGIGR